MYKGYSGTGYPIKQHDNSTWSTHVCTTMGECHHLPRTTAIETLPPNQDQEDGALTRNHIITAKGVF